MCLRRIVAFSHSLPQYTQVRIHPAIVKLALCVGQSSYISWCGGQLHPFHILAGDVRPFGSIDVEADGDLAAGWSVSSPSPSHRSLSPFYASWVDIPPSSLSRGYVVWG